MTQQKNRLSFQDLVLRIISTKLNKKTNPAAPLNSTVKISTTNNTTQGNFMLKENFILGNNQSIDERERYVLTLFWITVVGTCFIILFVLGALIFWVIYRCRARCYKNKHLEYSHHDAKSNNNNGVPLTVSIIPRLPSSARNNSFRRPNFEINSQSSQDSKNFVQNHHQSKRGQKITQTTKFNNCTQGACNQGYLGELSSPDQDMVEKYAPSPLPSSAVNLKRNSRDRNSRNSRNSLRPHSKTNRTVTTENNQQEILLKPSQLISQNSAKHSLENNQANSTYLISSPKLTGTLTPSLPFGQSRSTKTTPKEYLYSPPQNTAVHTSNLSKNLNITSLIKNDSNTNSNCNGNDSTYYCSYSNSITNNNCDNSNKGDTINSTFSMCEESITSAQGTVSSTTLGGGLTENSRNSNCATKLKNRGHQSLNSEILIDDYNSTTNDANNIHSYSKSHSNRKRRNKKGAKTKVRKSLLEALEDLAKGDPVAWKTGGWALPDQLLKQPPTTPEDREITMAQELTQQMSRLYGNPNNNNLIIKNEVNSLRYVNYPRRGSFDCLMRQSQQFNQQQYQHPNFNNYKNDFYSISARIHKNKLPPITITNNFFQEPEIWRASRRSYDINLSASKYRSPFSHNGGGQGGPNLILKVHEQNNHTPQNIMVKSPLPMISPHLLRSSKNKSKYFVQDNTPSQPIKTSTPLNHNLTNQTTNDFDSDLVTCDHVHSAKNTSPFSVASRIDSISSTFVTQPEKFTKNMNSPQKTTYTTSQTFTLNNDIFDKKEDIDSEWKRVVREIQELTKF